ncbi:hypothetical protein GQF42_08385 [Streptomyces broussonetiae]|uniref:Uncharacterized protein n=1 Tax=Streptomyces broussonetiae TaxID=2686304 RepID=A0A6I6N2S7_9ACTN|nr:hypothetical protein [Streptomyces broussonetiae]QHA03277.1 hypothetical protein GQF42_08385 [Streptomyces broussonetiae]
MVRPAVLVAVLLGLFLMHGGPAAANGGCHGAAPDAAAMPSAADATAGTADTTGAATEHVGMRSAQEHMAGATHTVGLQTVPARMAAATAVAPEAAHTAVAPSTTHTEVAPAAAAPGAPRATAGNAALRPLEATARPAEAMRGELCLATTTTRPGVPPPPSTAVACALPAAVLLPWARRPYGEARHRGPPVGGRDLLLQVCVTRT